MRGGATLTREPPPPPDALTMTDALGTDSRERDEATLPRIIDNVRARWRTRRTVTQNLQHDPRVIISVQNRSEPQSYLVLNGTATVTEKGADAHADKLAKRFLGVDRYSYRQPGEKRLIVSIAVDRLGGIGPSMRPWT